MLETELLIVMKHTEYMKIEHIPAFIYFNVQRFSGLSDKKKDI